MKKKQIIQKVIRTIEYFFGIYISRKPLDKYFNSFVEASHDEILDQCNGILHIGANIGEEAALYEAKNKPVIFIEADPEVYEKLEKNISKRVNQKSINVLLGNENKKTKFYLASNDSQSSSVLSFVNDDVFENVTTIGQIELDMRRLDTVFNLDELENFDHWIIDVQGAEKIVLDGCGELLSKCKSLLIECSTNEFYSGGVLWPEIRDYLRSKGFKNITSPRNFEHLNILFIRN